MQQTTNHNPFAPVAVQPPWRRDATTALDIPRPDVAIRRGARLGARLARLAGSASGRVNDAMPQHQTIYQSLGISPRGY